MMEFVSEITRERIRFRANGYAPSLAVQSPNGSDDAFYIKIDKHYGSSDHVTYMQHGIPAVMFITWPDNWYHSSQDTPDKQDSTQYKRAAVVATGRDDRAGDRRRRDGGAGRLGEPVARRRADGRVVSQGAVVHGRRARRRRRCRARTRRRSSPSRIRRASRRASSDRRARCSTTPPTARRRCRCSSR